MNKDNECPSNTWDQNLLIIIFVCIIGFIVWGKWIKPPESESNSKTKTREIRHMRQAVSPAVKQSVLVEPGKRNELVNEVKYDKKNAIPLLEQDPDILLRQGERLRKEAEAAKGNLERGPRASVLTEKEIRELEKRKAILQ